MHLCIEVYLVFCNNGSIKKHKMQSISVVIELNKYNNALYIHILMYLCADLKKRTVVRDKKLPKKDSLFDYFVSVIMDKVIHFGTISNKK